MSILRRVEGSVLWLLDDNQFVIENLRKEAKLHGVDPQRLIFAARVDNKNYLARFKMADLFLDTFPYNAGTTANDALFTGLPVLTLQGNTFVSRMCSSLLSAVNLPELIVETEIAYEDKAVALAANPRLLRDIKDKLASNGGESVLFDTAATAKYIEAAYQKIVQNSQAGLPPQTIYIDNSSKLA
jgi:predicted O-linked N-acetylglucosamine transferase (SPINDLY family)